MRSDPVTNKQRLYDDLAWVWPIVSPPEEYSEETEELCALIRRHARIQVSTLLHLGCGGGHNDYTFKRYFQVTGVDLSPAMLDLATKLNPDVSYRLGDMRNVRLGKVFDAVALLDSIGYMVSTDQLREAFITASAHLAPGGVFLVLVEEPEESFVQSRTYCSTHTKGDTVITLVENLYDSDRSDNQFEATLVFIIRRAGLLEIQTDHHICGLFTLQTYKDLLQESGFEVEQVQFSYRTLERHSGEEGRTCPLLICVKQP